MAESEKKYYDPEYDRIVDESVPKQQYEWFAKQSWFSELLMTEVTSF